MNQYIYLDGSISEAAWRAIEEIDALVRAKLEADADAAANN